MSASISANPIAVDVEEQHAVRAVRTVGLPAIHRERRQAYASAADFNSAFAAAMAAAAGLSLLGPSWASDRDRDQRGRRKRKPLPALLLE